MSRLNDLLRELRNREPSLARDLEREVSALADRRAFGLNFERHVPEAVELPGRKFRKGDKVHILPPRGQAEQKTDTTTWRVIDVSRDNGKATLETLTPPNLEPDSKTSIETKIVGLDDLVVVAEFRDPIYPGLVSTGKVERGGDKPYQVIINAENFHALETLLFTHRGKVDCIYIDPPYNTGAKDWKYNNDYVENDDLYRHSKWLAFMERRLLLAKELLNPTDSVLIVTIDEKEFLHLGLLLEQTLPDAQISMVSTVINPAGAGRESDFSRTDEYIYFLRFGRSAVLPEDRMIGETPVIWDTLRRSSLPGARGRKGPGACGPNQFYPIYVDKNTGKIAAIGEPLLENVDIKNAPTRSGCITVLPIRPDGTEMNWGITPDIAKKRLANGHLRAGKFTPNAHQKYVISYLTAGIVSDIESGKAQVKGKNSDGTVDAFYPTGREKMPTTNWNRPSHDAQRYGTEILKKILPGRTFPYPKSLYAVEDCLRFFLLNKKNAVILDFFSGSGTTAHAVMRLNRYDNGKRQCICITNNEVAAAEQKKLLRNNLRPGDPDWEQWGICEYITKPRIHAAITGKTPDRIPIDGIYKFTDEFPMSDGFKENAEFFTLTYEAPLRVASNREFKKIAPLLWIRAGSRGRRIEDISNGWDIADTYGVLADLDRSKTFIKAIATNNSITVAYIVTDDDRLFESIAQELPTRIEPVRLYEAYLRNFEIESGRGAL